MELRASPWNEEHHTGTPRLPLLLLARLSTLHSLHSGPSRAWGSAARGEHGRLPSPARSRAYMQWWASLISKSARTSPPALSDHRALGPGDFWNFASDPTTHPLHYLTVWDLLTSIVLERPRRAPPCSCLPECWLLPRSHLTHTWVVPHPRFRAICHISQPFTPGLGWPGLD